MYVCGNIHPMATQECSVFSLSYLVHGHVVEFSIHCTRSSHTTVPKVLVHSVYLIISCFQIAAAPKHYSTSQN